jgi:hypothetical protein
MHLQPALGIKKLVISSPSSGICEINFSTGSSVKNA